MKTFFVIKNLKEDMYLSESLDWEGFDSSKEFITFAAAYGALSELKPDGYYVIEQVYTHFKNK
jgi:hypothetical protein